VTRSRLAATAATVATVVVAGGALAVPGAASAKAAKVTLHGSGSSAAQTYVQNLFSAYHKLHPNVNFTYNPDGGNAGVKDVQQKKADFAIQTSPPAASDSGTVFDELFLDALTVGVNSSNPLGSLALPQVADVFLGTDTNWSQLPGAPLQTTIDAYGRNSTAGLYTIFSKAVLNGATQASGVTQEQTDGDVASRLATDGNGIGYVGLANSHKKGVKALKLSAKAGGTAYAPTIANIKLWAKDQKAKKSGGYPLTHFDWAVLPKGKVNNDVAAFFNWVINSPAAGSVINKSGAVAYFNK
jgi:phosphate transport system substrate-binding protein